MKKSLLAIGLLALGAIVALRQGSGMGEGGQPATVPPTTQAQFPDDSTLARAIASRQNGVQVSGRGTVTKVLADDREGSRHQRFLIRPETGGSVLIAHNIDLAPRVDPLEAGDTVEFSGEFEWNEKGGVLHWTHRDPARRHVGGWIRRNGVTFQ